jgi:hypothetical protein
MKRLHADGERRPDGSYRFVHASDLFLDAPVRGVAGAPPALRAALRDASLLAWRAVVDEAVAREAAFVVVAGGLFDPKGVTQRAAAALYEGLGRLRERSIDVLIALAAEEAAVAAELPWLAERAILFPPDRLMAVRVPRDGRYLATVHGASGGRQDVTALASTCRRLGSGLEIGVFPHALGPERDARPPAELATAALDYWALGGARAHMVFRERPWAVCAGATQGRSFAADELGPKGCVVVEVEGGHVAQVAHVALEAVRFLVVEADADGCPDLAVVCDRLLQAAEAPRAGVSTAPQVAEAVLRGAAEGALAGDRLAGEAGLLAALRRESARRAPDLWWTRVRDRTVRSPGPTPPTFALLRRILIDQSEVMNAPLPRSSFLGRAFAPLLHVWEAECDLDEQRELVREAVDEALRALAAEGPQ